MIGSLRGVLLERSLDGEVLVEVGGVGYRVVVTPATASGIGAVHSEVFLHVQHHIREDAQTLYGFRSRDERVAFEALIGAHGVGPALALAILSVHTPAQLHHALANDDIDALVLVPGVGKKTATRLLVELKSRLKLPEVDLAALNGDAPTIVMTSAQDDVRAALTGLGYGTDEIRGVLAELPGDGEPAELVRLALRRLAVRS